MANPWAGEVELVIDGHCRCLKLTLGALAELEAGLGEDTLLALINRFESADVSAKDIMALLVAGLRGGGWKCLPGDLISADIEGGLLGAVEACGRMLALSFAAPAAK